MTKKFKRGGLRNPPGGHPGNKALGRPIREKHSCTLAPGTKAAAQKLAKKRQEAKLQKTAGWGYVVDEGIMLLQALDEMGISGDEAVLILRKVLLKEGKS